MNKIEYNGNSMETYPELPPYGHPECMARLKKAVEIEKVKIKIAREVTKRAEEERKEAEDLLRDISMMVAPKHNQWAKKVIERINNHFKMKGKTNR